MGDGGLAGIKEGIVELSQAMSGNTKLTDLDLTGVSRHLCLWWDALCCLSFCDSCCHWLMLHAHNFVVRLRVYSSTVHSRDFWVHCNLVFKY